MSETRNTKRQADDAESARPLANAIRGAGPGTARVARFTPEMRIDGIEGSFRDHASSRAIGTTNARKEWLERVRAKGGPPEREARANLKHQSPTMSNPILGRTPDVLVEILPHASYDPANPDTPPDPGVDRFKRVTDCASAIIQVHFHGTATTPVGVARRVECYIRDLETGDFREITVNLKPGESRIRIAEFGFPANAGTALRHRTYLVAAKPLPGETNLRNNVAMSQGLCA